MGAIFNNENFYNYRGEEGEIKTKAEFIKMARLIAKESEEVVKLAKQVANACTDKRMKRVNGRTRMTRM